MTAAAPKRAVHAKGLQDQPPGRPRPADRGQRAAAAAVAAALPALVAAAEAAAAALARRAPARLCRGRQLGADGARRRARAPRHLRPPARRVPVLFAGGAAALLATTGAVEDEPTGAAADLDAAGLGAGDA